MKLNATVALKGALPLPCLLPVAIVWGVVERVNVPAEHVPVGFPTPPVVTLLHEN